MLAEIYQLGRGASGFIGDDGVTKTIVFEREVPCPDLKPGDMDRFGLSIPTYGPGGTKLDEGRLVPPNHFIDPDGKKIHEAPSYWETPDGGRQIYSLPRNASCWISPDGDYMRYEYAPGSNGHIGTTIVGKGKAGKAYIDPYIKVEFGGEGRGDEDLIVPIPGEPTSDEALATADTPTQGDSCQLATGGVYFEDPKTPALATDRTTPVRSKASDAHDNENNLGQKDFGVIVNNERFLQLPNWMKWHTRTLGDGTLLLTGVELPPPTSGADGEAKFSRVRIQPDGSVDRSDYYVKMAEIHSKFGRMLRTSKNGGADKITVELDEFADAVGAEFHNNESKRFPPAVTQKDGFWITADASEVETTAMEKCAEDAKRERE